MNRYATTLQIDPGHPALPGHFPGAAIVPGVIWLGEVLDTARAQLGFHAGPTSWQRVRFVRPVAPATPVRLELEGSPEVFSFRIATLDNEPVATGRCRHAALE